MTTKNNKKFLARLADETLESVISDLYYGVEIEFGEGGCLAPKQEECPYTEDDAIDNIESQGADFLTHYLHGGWSRQAYEIAQEILRNMSMEDAINQCTAACWDGVVSQELESLEESWEPSYNEDDWVDIPGWEHDEEGTPGIEREYRTDEPVGLQCIADRVNRLMREAGGEAVVPLNGSCHVHVSIPGSHHAATYESRLHCCILYELSQFVDDFPSRVLKRLSSQYMEKYFHLSAGCHGAYPAVHCHGQGSWEFRLFGGLTDPAEIMRCVEIAGKALVLGYKRFYAKEYRFPLGDSDVQTFRHRFADAILAGERMPLSMIMGIPVSEPEPEPEQLTRPHPLGLWLALPSAETQPEMPEQLTGGIAGLWLAMTSPETQQEMPEHLLV